MVERTISTFMIHAAQRLAEAGRDDPQQKARLFVAHILQVQPELIPQIDHRLLTSDNEAHIQRLVDRHLEGEPISRILGKRFFCGLPFGLNEATLDPKFISEVLVEVSCRFLKKGVLAKLLYILKLSQDSPAPRILDLGTGTGCLLLSVLHSYPHATGLGVDLAPRALEQAMSNAKKLGLEGRAQFILSDWFEKINEPFDLIISNPPYVPHAELIKSSPQTDRYDPTMALDGGMDGLDAYRSIIQQLPQFLKPQGMVVLEPGDNQEKAIKEMLRKAGLSHITSYRDAYNTVRCISARRKTA